MMTTRDEDTRRRRYHPLMQFPITPEERRRLKHQAIDQGVTVGEIVRQALGFSAQPATKEAATG